VPGLIQATAGMREIQWRALLLFASRHWTPTRKHCSLVNTSHDSTAVHPFGAGFFLPRKLRGERSCVDCYLKSQAAPRDVKVHDAEIACGCRDPDLGLGGELALEGAVTSPPRDWRGES
jgi:hypothetical protein